MIKIFRRLFGFWSNDYVITEQKKISQVSKTDTTKRSQNLDANIGHAKEEEKRPIGKSQSDAEATLPAPEKRRSRGHRNSWSKNIPGRIFPTTIQAQMFVAWIRESGVHSEKELCVEMIWTLATERFSVEADLLLANRNPFLTALAKNDDVIRKYDRRLKLTANGTTKTTTYFIQPRCRASSIDPVVSNEIDLPPPMQRIGTSARSATAHKVGVGGADIVDQRCQPGSREQR